MTNGDKLILATLRKTVGPLPWYFDNLPKIRSSNQKLVWRRAAAARDNNCCALLHVAGQTDRVVLGVAMYTTVFPLWPNLIGLWFQDGLSIRVSAFDVDALPEFSINELAADQPGDRPGYVAGAAPVGEFYFSRDAIAEDRRIELPTAFSGMQSLMMPGNYAMVQEAACMAIFEIVRGRLPGTWRLRTMPQKWFNRDDFDMGYAWITRATRDPQSNRVIGEGFRIKPFVLKEDGCHLDRWIESDSP